jgi:hypothetical protein
MHEMPSTQMHEVPLYSTRAEDRCAQVRRGSSYDNVPQSQSGGCDSLLSQKGLGYLDRMHDDSPKVFNNAMAQTPQSSTQPPIAQLPCKGQGMHTDIDYLLQQNKAAGDLAWKLLQDLEGHKIRDAGSSCLSASIQHDAGDCVLADELANKSYDTMMSSLSSLALDGSSTARSDASQISQISQLPVELASHDHFGKTCTICHKEYTKSCTLMVLPCRHAYHFNCISRWFNKHNTCPVCRDDVTQSRSQPGSGSADTVLELRIREEPSLRMSAEILSSNAASSREARKHTQSVPVPGAAARDSLEEDGLSVSPKNVTFTNMIPYDLTLGQRSMHADSPSAPFTQLVTPQLSESSSSSGSMFSLGVKPSPKSAFSSPLRKSLARPMPRRPVSKRQ